MHESFRFLRLLHITANILETSILEQTLLALYSVHYHHHVLKAILSLG